MKESGEIEKERVTVNKGGLMGLTTKVLQYFELIILGEWVNDKSCG